ncbi:hypothetical protein [uncultured Sphingomonas sp.]|uniref:hypothetical protein n=1 Tax=uncultured Sphingomonas sp. TaxID=158754 RepID=UPI0035CBFB3E
MLQLQTRVIKLRIGATLTISLLPVIPPASEIPMRNLDTWTGGLFAVAAIVLALEAVLAL